MKFRLAESTLKKATPYMLRNDGELLECGRIHPYIQSVSRRGADYDDEYFITALNWFWHNSKKQKTKELIEIVTNHGLKNGLIPDKLMGLIDIPMPPNTYLCDKGLELASIVDALNDDTNQEFCRVRTSNMLLAGSNDDIYFRISSIGFNWFNLIWQVVYDHHPTTVTICKDTATFGGVIAPYKINGKSIDHIPAEEFITLEGNPIIEQKEHQLEAINYARKQLSIGKSLSETYDWLHPHHMHRFYLSQVEESLGYDINNLLRK